MARPMYFAYCRRLASVERVTFGAWDYQSVCAVA